MLLVQVRSQLLSALHKTNLTLRTKVVRGYIFVVLLEVEIRNLDCAGTLEDSVNASATFGKAAGKNDGIC